MFRGIEGFGLKHRLQTELLLSLSEDLPIVAVALDSEARIAAAVRELGAGAHPGMITLERLRILGKDDSDLGVPAQETVKLTVNVGRQERVQGRAAHLVALDCLRGHGLAGATVLLGLDGHAHGVRRRGRMTARNGQVPLTIVSVGEAAGAGGALRELAPLLQRPSMTIERVRVCRRDGEALAPPQSLQPQDAAGRGYWQKLILYTDEQARCGGEPLHGALIRRLRREGAAGATAIRGIHGFHGEGALHGERFWTLARHSPVLVEMLDTPANMARWFPIVEEMTAETGLVTSELVPALRSTGPEVVHGGLELASAIPPERPTLGAGDPERKRSE